MRLKQGVVEGTAVVLVGEDGKRSPQTEVLVIKTGGIACKKAQRY